MCSRRRTPTYIGMNGVAPTSTTYQLKTSFSSHVMASWLFSFSVSSSPVNRFHEATVDSFTLWRTLGCRRHWLVSLRSTRCRCRRGKLSGRCWATVWRSSTCRNGTWRSPAQLRPARSRWRGWTPLGYSCLWGLACPWYVTRLIRWWKEGLGESETRGVFNLIGDTRRVLTILATKSEETRKGISTGNMETVQTRVKKRTL